MHEKEGKEDLAGPSPVQRLPGSQATRRKEKKVWDRKGKNTIGIARAGGEKKAGRKREGWDPHGKRKIPSGRKQEEGEPPPSSNLLNLKNKTRGR